MNEDTSRLLDEQTHNKELDKTISSPTGSILQPPSSSSSLSASETAYVIKDSIETSFGHDTQVIGN